MRMVNEALGVDAKTVCKGKSKPMELPDTPPKYIRRSGGGTKKLNIHLKWLIALAIFRTKL
jgi:hypothetical protein